MWEYLNKIICVATLGHNVKTLILRKYNYLVFQSYVTTAATTAAVNACLKEIPLDARQSRRYFELVVLVVKGNGALPEVHGYCTCPF